MPYVRRKTKIFDIQLACGFGDNKLEVMLVDVLLTLPSMAISLDSKMKDITLADGVHWDLSRDLLTEQSQEMVDYLHEVLYEQDYKKRMDQAC